MSEVWNDVVTTFWNVANEMLDDVPTAVLSEGGVVVIDISNDLSLGVNLVFQELSQESIDELKKALAEGKALVFYYAPNADSDDDELEIKSIVLKGKTADLEGAIEEINAHIKRTGGISLTLRERLEGDSDV